MRHPGGDLRRHAYAGDAFSAGSTEYTQTVRVNVVERSQADGRPTETARTSARPRSGGMDLPDATPGSRRTRRAWPGRKKWNARRRGRRTDPRRTEG